MSVFVNQGAGSCCLTSPQCELTGHAYLAVTNRYLVTPWPEVLMQQRRSGGTDVNWVKLGRINCRCVVGNSRSQSNQLILVSLKAACSLSWHTDRCIMERRIQAKFTQEETNVLFWRSPQQQKRKKMKEPVCCGVVDLNKHKNRAYYEAIDWGVEDHMNNKN